MINHDDAEIWIQDNRDIIDAELRELVRGLGGEVNSSDLDANVLERFIKWIYDSGYNAGAEFGATIAHR